MFKCHSQSKARENVTQETQKKHKQKKMQRETNKTMTDSYCYFNCCDILWRESCGSDARYWLKKRTAQTSCLCTYLCYLHSGGKQVRGDSRFIKIASVVLRMRKWMEKELMCSHIYAEQDKVTTWYMLQGHFPLNELFPEKICENVHQKW